MFNGKKRNIYKEVVRLSDCRQTGLSKPVNNRLRQAQADILLH